MLFTALVIHLIGWQIEILMSLWYYRIFQDRPDIPALVINNFFLWPYRLYQDVRLIRPILYFMFKSKK